MSDPANPLKTYHQRQIDDQATPVRLYGENGGPATVQLSGSSVAEALDQDDAVANVLTFAASITAVEVYHAETDPQDFIINGITIPIGPGGWRSPIAGTPSATVTIPASVDCVVSRLV